MLRRAIDRLGFWVGFGEHVGVVVEGVLEVAELAESAVVDAAEGADLGKSFKYTSLSVSPRLLLLTYDPIGRILSDPGCSPEQNEKVVWPSRLHDR